MKMFPPPLIYWSPVTVIWFLRWIRRLCIQITVLSLSLVILLGFTWDFKMEETTHDSSSSRKSEEKCPPAGGIKMKIGGFKTGHRYHKPSDAAIQQEPSGVSSGDWLPRALHSCETVNRKINCGLTPNKNGNCAEFFFI